jgi:hypothetical protein
LLEGVRLRRNYGDRLIRVTTIKHNVKRELSKLKQYKDQDISVSARAIKLILDIIEEQSEKDIRGAMDNNGKVIIGDDGGIKKVPSMAVAAKHIPSELWL